MRLKTRKLILNIIMVRWEKNSKSIFIPPGFAHGFCALSKENYIVYSCTKYRNKRHEIGHFCKLFVDFLKYLVNRRINYFFNHFTAPKLGLT